MLETNPNLRQHIEQFDMRHGGNAVAVDGWLLFADGARRELRQPGQMLEPPPDETARCQQQIRYRDAWLQQAVREANELAARNRDTPAKRVDRFDAAHGRDAILVDGWLYYSDGATREPNTLGALIDPPSNPVQRGKLQVQYREELLRQATEEFQNMKRLLTLRAQEASRHAAANSPPPLPSPAEVGQLKALQATVQQRQQDLDAARAALAAAKPQQLRTRDARAANIREQADGRLSEIDAIKI